MQRALQDLSLVLAIAVKFELTAREIYKRSNANRQSLPVVIVAFDLLICGGWYLEAL
jgi:ATP-dependent DNA ligase